jgi:competence protein ComEA
VVELPRPLPPPSWRDWQPPPVWVLLVGALGLLALIAGAIAFTSRAETGPDVALTLPRADTVDDADPSTATTVGGDLHVHAAGAVARPGVVTVPAGARVTDVVAAAGGPAGDADLDQVNLAAPVTDGERVYIPRRGETAVAVASGGGSAAAADGIVNINTADTAALETLPGVGPATAKAIIDYRAEHGRFKSLDELLNVRGIGPSKLSQIKPHARV